MVNDKLGKIEETTNSFRSTFNENLQATSDVQFFQGECFIMVVSWCLFWCSESCSHFRISLHASITEVILQFDSIPNLHCQRSPSPQFWRHHWRQGFDHQKKCRRFFWSALVKHHELHLNRQHPECVAVHVQNICGMTFIISVSQDAFQRTHWFLFASFARYFLFSTGCSRWCGYRTDYWYHGKGPAGRLAQFVGGKHPL